MNSLELPEEDCSKQWEILLLLLSAEEKKIDRTRDSEVEVMNYFYHNEGVRKILQHWLLQMDSMYAKTSTSLDTATKCDDISLSWREKGNRCFRNNAIEDSYGCYTKSVLFAVPNGEMYPLALANRSAALMRLKRYKDCLADIELALEHGYPDSQRHKLFLRQEYCHTELRQAGKATAALDQAQLHAESLNLPPTIANDSNRHQKLFRSSSEALGGAEPPWAASQAFAHASVALELRHNETVGRHVATRVPVRRGDVLFAEDPYAFVPLPADGGLAAVCENCCRADLNPVPCSVCSRAVYCGEACRALAWRAHHRWECAGAQARLFPAIGVAHLALRVLLVAANEGLPALPAPAQPDVAAILPAPVQPDAAAILPAPEQPDAAAILAAPAQPDAAAILPAPAQPDAVASLSAPAQPDAAAILPAPVQPDAATILSAPAQPDAAAILPAPVQPDAAAILPAPAQPDAAAILPAPAQPDAAAILPAPAQPDAAAILAAPAQLDAAALLAAYAQLDGVQVYCAGAPPFLRMFHLVTNFDKMENVDYIQYALTATMLTLYLETFTSFFTHFPSRLPCRLPQSQVKLLAAALLLRAMGQLVCNAHLTLSSTDSTGDAQSTAEGDVSYASAIYPSAAMMNHSCDPNIVNTFHGHRLIVRGGRALRAGAEVLNCYGPHSARQPAAERQALLRAQYHFTCTCDPCLAGLGPGGSSFHGHRLIVRGGRALRAGAEVLNCYGPHSARQPAAERQALLRAQYHFTCTCDPCLAGLGPGGSSFHGHRLIVRGGRALRAGAEVLNCYGPHSARQPAAERQALLRAQYHFTCTCDPCLAGLGPGGSSFHGHRLIVRGGRALRAGAEVLNCYGPHSARQPAAERQALLRAQYHFTCTCDPCLAGLGPGGSS